MNPLDYLQFGALGVLALVLTGLGILLRWLGNKFFSRIATALEKIASLSERTDARLDSLERGTEALRREHNAHERAEADRFARLRAESVRGKLYSAKGGE